MRKVETAITYMQPALLYRLASLVVLYYLHASYTIPEYMNRIRLCVGLCDHNNAGSNTALEAWFKLDYLPVNKAA